MSNRTIALNDALYDYMLSVSVRDLPVLKELRERTAQLAHASMQISPEQGQFMQWLVGTLQARRTIEVGVFTGYSSLVTALALPADGEVIALDISTEYTDIAKPFWKRAGVDHRIKLRIGPAVDALRAMIAAGESGKFDFAFIDADKENYDNYYEALLPLLRVGGVIAIDNVLWSGRVADKSSNDSATLSLRALNTKLAGDQRIALSMLPVGDGLTLIRKL
jgi:predicted O-methyltransferase YrrM